MPVEAVKGVYSSLSKKNHGVSRYCQKIFECVSKNILTNNEQTAKIVYEAYTSFSFPLTTTRTDL